MIFKTNFTIDRTKYCKIIILVIYIIQYQLRYNQCINNIDWTCHITRKLSINYNPTYIPHKSKYQFLIYIYNTQISKLIIIEILQHSKWLHTCVYTFTYLNRLALVSILQFMSMAEKLALQGTPKQKQQIGQGKYLSSNSYSYPYVFENVRVDTLLTTYNAIQNRQNNLTYNKNSPHFKNDSYHRINNHKNSTSNKASVTKSQHISKDQLKQNNIASFKVVNNKHNRKFGQTKQTRQKFRSIVRVRRTYKYCQDREKYVNFKSDMEQLTAQIDNNCHSLQLGKFMAIKQKIMVNFFNHYIDQVSRQNIDKAELLANIWKSLFSLVQKAVEKICFYTNMSECMNMKQQVDIHQKYQKLLSETIKQKKIIKEEHQKGEKFNKIVVAKLREYKKCIKKLEENLRIAADKLNQFRRGYLQMQIQCINMTMEFRNLGQESAQLMVKRKMALTMQKSKQYKILPSKKKTKKYLKSLKINAQNLQNQKIKGQIYQAFASNLNQKPQALSKIVSRAIQAIHDKDQSKPIDYTIFNQNLVQNKYLGEQLMVDKQTDMQGFTIQKQDKKVSVNAHQLRYYQMTKTKGVQTLPIEKPSPKTQNVGIQCEFNIIKANKFYLYRSYDMSFLFQNTNKNSILNMRQQAYARSFLNELQKSKRKNDAEANIYINEGSSQYQLDYDKKKQKQSNVSIYERADSRLSSYNLINAQQNNKQNQFQLTGNLQVKRGIKKLASTFSNKVSFLNNFLNEKYRRQTRDDLNFEQNKKDMQQITLQGIQRSHTNLLLIQQDKQPIDLKQRNKNNTKSIKKIKFSELKKDKERQKDKYKYRYNKNKLTQQSLKRNTRSFNNFNYSSHNKVADEIQKSTSQRKRKLRTFNQSAPKQNKPISYASKTGKIYKGSMKKQYNINYTEMYRDLKIQLQKIRPNTGATTIQQYKNANKIKQLSKSVQMVWQLFQKQYEHQYLNLNTSSKINSRHSLNQDCDGLRNQFMRYIFQMVNNKYGFANNNHIRKKTILLIKDIFKVQQKNPILKLFILMVGFNEEGHQVPQFCDKNNQLIIKLVNKIYNNWKLPIKFQQVDLVSNFQQIIQKQLIEQGFCFKFVQKFICYISQKRVFRKNATGLNTNMSSSYNNSNTYEYFQPIVHIYNFLSHEQRLILNGYEPILELAANKINVDQKNGYHRHKDENITQRCGQFPIVLVELIIQLHFFSKQQNIKIKQKLKDFCCKKLLNTTIDKSNFAYLCCQLGIMDFLHLYYKALSKFQLKQNQLFTKQKNIISKINIHIANQQLIQNICRNCIAPEDDTQFDKFIKTNLLTLLYLKTLDCYADNLLQQVLGDNLYFLYDHSANWVNENL